MSVHSYEELKTHLGHKIKCVVCQRIGVVEGKFAFTPESVAIECETCGCVLLGFEKPARCNDGD